MPKDGSRNLANRLKPNLLAHPVTHQNGNRRRLLLSNPSRFHAQRLLRPIVEVSFMRSGGKSNVSKGFHGQGIRHKRLLSKISRKTWESAAGPESSPA